MPTTLAWVIGGAPTYALEGNILFSGATLAWAAEHPHRRQRRPTCRPGRDGAGQRRVTLVPAFAGLGAPHWDRNAHA